MSLKVISIKNQIAQLENLASELEQITEEWNLSMNDSLNLNLVLEELVTNTIFYGYEDKNEHMIDIMLSYDDKIVQIQLEDDGREFNPLLYKEPDLDLSLEDRKIGGLGIHFVRKIMDQISYRRLDNRNILILKKNIV